MQRLLTFLLRYRVFNLFVFLEAIAFWLIFNFNISQNLVFLSSSNQAIGSIYGLTGNIAEYFSLKGSNEQLSEENARLRQVLSSLYAQAKMDDKIDLPTPYRYAPAKVISNSILYSNNYFTIDAGTDDGVKVGMGVITSSGITGQVKAVSKNFAAVFSLLHSNVSVSSQLKKDGTLCSVRWKAGAIGKAQLMHLPNHVNVSVGDSVVTSGYSAVYPEGVLIGVVSDLERENSESFKSAEIDLAVDFSNLSYVYVVQNAYLNELDSLWKDSGIEAEERK